MFWGRLVMHPNVKATDKSYTQAAMYQYVDYDLSITTHEGQEYSSKICDIIRQNTLET